LLFPRHSQRLVHFRVRGEPHVRLDRSRSRAVPQQPADPSSRRVQGQRRRYGLGAVREPLAVDERAFFNESRTTKAATLNCPFCRSSEQYEPRWLVRKEKDRTPPGADERDRAKFAKAQNYMLLLDDKVACKNMRCRKRFDVSGVKTVAYLVD